MKPATQTTSRNKWKSFGIILNRLRWREIIRWLLMRIMNKFCAGFSSTRWHFLQLVSREHYCVLVCVCVCAEPVIGSAPFPTEPLHGLQDIWAPRMLTEPTIWLLIFCTAKTKTLSLQNHIKQTDSRRSHDSAASPCVALFVCLSRGADVISPRRHVRGNQRSREGGKEKVERKRIPP